MAATEKQRLAFVNKIRDEWGDPHAEAFMEMVPPTQWSHLATKADLDRYATKDDVIHMTNRFVTWMLAGLSVQTAVIGILLVITR